jgi:ADP-ribosylglycohydrolase
MELLRHRHVRFTEYGMLGALHGVRCLPERWLDGLEGRDLIERAADALYRAVRTS